MTIDLTAILSAPDDDAPRLALAQQLEAAGDPRGVFIRTQLKAATERKARGASADYWSLVATACAMLNRYGAEWTKDVAALVKDPIFHRGFIEHVTMDARTFLARGLELYRLAPIRAVTLTGAKVVMPEVAGSQLLRRLLELGLQVNEVGDAGAVALARSPQPINLRLLDLSFNGITRAGLDAIAGSPILSRLDFLNLAGNPCGEPSETFGIDETTGQLAPGTEEMTDLGKELVQRRRRRGVHGSATRMPAGANSFRERYETQAGGRSAAPAAVRSAFRDERRVLQTEARARDRQSDRGCGSWRASGEGAGVRARVRRRRRPAAADARKR